MIELKYLNSEFKIYENGIVERYHKRYNKWVICSNKKKHKNNDYGYIRLEIDKQNIYLHRLIYKAYNPEWDIKDKMEIDHIDGDKLNNNINNLRLITKHQNMFNYTKAKGCCFNKKMNKWQSYITRDYKHIHLGYFDTEEKAHQEYLIAKT